MPCKHPEIIGLRFFYKPNEGTLRVVADTKEQLNRFKDTLWYRESGMMLWSFDTGRSIIEYHIDHARWKEITFREFRDAL